MHLFRCLLYNLLFALVSMVVAQTPLYPPSPKIDFSTIGTTKSQNKAEMKRLNDEEKLRKKEVRALKKDMRKKTGWSKDSIDQYGDYMSRMKPKEFQKFKGKYAGVSENTQELRDQRKEQIAGVKNGLGLNTPELPKDSLGNPISYEELPDSLKALYGTQMGGTAEQLQQTGEEGLSGFLKGYHAQNAPTSQSLVADMTSAMDPSQGPTEVKPYLSKFETYKDRRPDQVNAEEMGEGIAEAKAKQKVNEKTNVLKDLINQENEAFQQKSTIQRFRLGGYIQYHFIPQSLDIAPTLGFQLTSRMTIGLGYNKRILFEEPDSASVIGKRIFVQYDLIGSIFLHGESEWLQQGRGELGVVTERNTQIGLGTAVKMGRFDGTITALYNLNPVSTIQTGRFSLRYGINFL